MQEDFTDSAIFFCLNEFQNYSWIRQLVKNTGSILELQA